MQNFVEFRTAVELKQYAEEVKKNNLSIIGTASESPLEVGSYDGTITGNMSRIVGKTNGTLDRIPFNPTTMLKKNTKVSFEIYLDKKGLKRGRLVE